VGINTSTPTAAKLVVLSSDNTITMFGQNIDSSTTLGNSFVSRFRNGFDGNGLYSLASFQVQNAAGTDQISFIGAQSVTGAGNYSSNTVFGVRSGASTFAEYMRIVGSTGNLLLNTTSDNGQKLQVNGDAYVNGLGTFTGANLQSGNQYLRSANVPLPHSTTTTILRFFNNAGNLSGQNAIFGIINIFVGWNAGYNLGSNIYTYSISCSTNGVGVLSLLSSNVVGSSLVTSVTASADGTGCKIDVTTNGTSNPLNANCWVTFSGNFF
jgi:hypothetical protein